MNEESTTPEEPRPNYTKGFPTRYAGLPLPTHDDWLDATSTAAKALEKGGIVILHGGKGVGKTFMAYELGRYGVFPQMAYPDRTPRPAIYKTAMRIFLEIRNTFRRDSEMSELEVMDYFADASLLVIDEIQERGETVFEDQKLTAIIDARYQHNRPTLIIGNYETAQDFATSVSPSILSRMQEGGGAIHCNWPSFRDKKRKDS